MSEARGHHYISQFYLRGFTENGSKNSKLFVVDLKRRSKFETKPANVARIRDFNRIEDRPAGEVEGMLAQVEGELHTALEKVIADRTLNDGAAWPKVLELIASFAVRHPAQRENVRQWMAQIAKISMDMVTATPERYETHTRKAREAGYLSGDTDVSYDSMREFLRGDSYTIEVATSRHLQLEFGVIEPVYRTLLDRKWDLFIAAEGSGSFITCDRPVVLFHCDGSPQSLHRPLGHGLAATALYFPLNRSMAVLGMFESGGAVRTADARLVEILNRNAAANATEQVYSPSPRVRLRVPQSIFVADLLNYTQPRERPS